ncbi:MAG: hypothetical protein AAF633_23425, partial [Chloroflexota bacterium]
TRETLLETLSLEHNKSEKRSAPRQKTALTTKPSLPPNFKGRRCWMKKNRFTPFEQQVQTVQIIYINLLLMGLVVIIGSRPAEIMDQLTQIISKFLIY